MVKTLVLFGATAEVTFFVDEAEAEVTISFQLAVPELRYPIAVAVSP
jgi:hypothetical protein